MQEIAKTEIDNLDLSQIAALQQKRTLAFVNHFVITTVQFLNNFSRTCEQKLMHFERKLEKVNATMILLEARLSSIPEVNTAQTLANVDKRQPETQPEEKVDTPSQDPSSTIDSSINKEASATEDTVKVQVKPEYERFVKMVQVGVPLQAVKLKLSLEGLEPDELDKMLAKQ